MATDNTVGQALGVQRFALTGDCGETLRRMGLSWSATPAQPPSFVRRNIWCVINSAFYLYSEHSSLLPSTSSFSALFTHRSLFPSSHSFLEDRHPLPEANAQQSSIDS